MNKEDWIEEHRKECKIQSYPKQLVKTELERWVRGLHSMENFRNGMTPAESVQQSIKEILHSYANMKNSKEDRYGKVVVTEENNICTLLSVQDEHHNVLKVIWEKK